ncbi:ABC transporter substrate-binding protein [Derxia gummosa]|uniref:Putative aliphatic sulfonates-binding protein n=1 Tax=Derxia gummosa DSM 723 TaxID=1121388 RepID=A0A8B6X827_9BURK|nr:ABC transporter substrate-binding protein [Derxia gummosa]
MNDHPLLARRRLLALGAALPGAGLLGAGARALGGLAAPGAATTVAGTGLAALAPDAHAAGIDLSKQRIRIGTYKGGDRLALRAAGQDDFPYTVDFAEFSGGNLIVEALNAGSLDLGSGSEIPPIFAAQSNTRINLRVVAVLKDDVNSQVVLVPKDSTAKTIADLRGKRVGYVRATTTHYYLLRMLEDAGLGFADIDPVNLSPADGFAAFRSGKLDAWAIYGYNVPLAKTQAGARVLRNAGGYLSGNYLYYAHPDAIADAGRRAAVADYLQRLARAAKWFEANADAYARLYAKEIRVSEDAILELYRNRSQPRRLVAPADAEIRSQQLVADTFAKARVLDAKVDVAPLWDRAFAGALGAV